MEKRNNLPEFNDRCSPNCCHYSYLKQECLSRVVRSLDIKGQPIELGDPCLHPGTYEPGGSSGFNSNSRRNLIY